MKYCICLLFLIFLCNAEVYSQDSNYLRKNISSFYGMNSKSLDLWRKDTNGCFGIREKFIDTIFKNKLLIGMPKKLFFILFGKPDISVEENEVYSYYSSCQCDKKGKHLPDSDFKMLSFVFKDGKLLVIDFGTT